MAASFRPKLKDRLLTYSSLFKLQMRIAFIVAIVGPICYFTCFLVLFVLSIGSVVYRESDVAVYVCVCGNVSE